MSFLFGRSRRYQRRSGCGMRLLLALFLVVFAAGTYYCNTQENPLTGEKQRVALTPEQEVRLGLQSAPEMASQMGGVLPDDHPKTQAVRALGQRLLAQLPPEHPYRFSFHVLADAQTVNAFALPGGPIFITQGLLDQLTVPDQVAGVLGHEIGHVIERHAAEHMATSQFYQQLVMATGVGTGDYSATQVANYISQLKQLSYSRNDELESDLWGLRLLEQAGFDPHAMLAVMDVLENASAGKGGSEMLQTHPHPESRRQKIQEYLARQAKSSGGSKSPEWWAGD